MKLEHLTITKRNEGAYDVTNGERRIAAIREVGDGEWIIRDDVHFLRDLMTFAGVRFASAREAFAFIVQGVMA